LADGAGCIHGLRLREPRLASRSHPVVVVVVLPGVVVVVVVVPQRPRGSSSSSLGTEGPGYSHGPREEARTTAAPDWRSCPRGDLEREAAPLEEARLSFPPGGFKASLT
jgi:hypothetical protein